jgi:hypothetical protein
MRGGYTKNISDVILFDALYGHTEEYVHWIENFNGRFINIYTDQGGTMYETENLMQDFDAWKILYLNIEESKLKITDLTDKRLILIHTDLTHNEVISARKQFRDYLKTSKLSSIEN